MDLFLKISVVQAKFLLAGRFGKLNVFGRKVWLGNGQFIVSEGI